MAFISVFIFFKNKIFDGSIISKNKRIKMLSVSPITLYTPLIYIYYNLSLCVLYVYKLFIDKVNDSVYSCYHTFIYR